MTGRAGPARVRELAEQGLGRNACARELGVSRRAVDRAAREAGIEWSRTATEAATAARMADVRASLADDFSHISDRAAERLLEALDADELDPHVLRSLMNVAATSTDKLTSLADRLTTADDHGQSILDRLAAGFGEWAEWAANTPPETDRPTTDQHHQLGDHHG